MPAIPSVDSGVLTSLWAELALLLALSRLLGWAASRIGLPATVGYLAAGLVLGPSVLGRAAPSVAHWLLPPGGEQGVLLSGITNVALVFLLLVIGVGHEPSDGDGDRRLTGLVTAGSYLLPLAAGLGTYLLLPRSMWGHHLHPWATALLVASTVAVSSLPVIARLIADLDLGRHPFARLAISTSTVQDVLGFLALAAVTTMTTGRSGWTAVTILAGGTALALGAAAGGRRLADRLLRVVRSGDGGGTGGSLALAAVATFALAALVQELGVEGALGGFLVGAVLSRARLMPDGARQQLQRWTEVLFTPLFFGAAGLRVDLGVLRHPALAFAVIGLTAVSLVAKFAGAAISSRLAGRSTAEAVATGVLLNGRGAVQVVLAGGGLDLGLLSPSGYTVVLTMAVLSALAAATVLPAAARRVGDSPAERQRLRRRAQLDANSVVRKQRLLVPWVGDSDTAMAAQVLDWAWPAGAPLVVVGPDGRRGRADLAAVTDRCPDRPVEVVGAADVVRGTVAETRLGCAAVAVTVAGAGAMAENRPHRLLTASHAPLVLVRPAWASGGLPDPERVLLASDGGPGSRAAEELACAVGERLDGRLQVAHVVDRVAAAASVGGGNGDSAPVLAGDAVLAWAVTTAGELGVSASALPLEGAEPGPALVDAAIDHDVDLVVAGATVRPAGDSAFLGPTVEHLLEHCPAAVVVVALPGS